jgi:hypothetical protein
VLGGDLEIDVILAAVDVAILDAAVGKMDLLVGLYDTLPISRTYLERVTVCSSEASLRRSIVSRPGTDTST